MKIELIYLSLINLFSFCLFGLDKWFAQHHKYRISEKILFFFSLIGGCFGALLAMYLFHHKTKKKRFMILLPCLALGYLLLLMKTK